MFYEVPISFIDNPINENEICRSKQIHVDGEGENKKYIFNDFGLQCMLNKLQYEYNTKKSTYDSIINPQNYDDMGYPRMQQPDYGNIQQFDTTYIKYISILERPFQFYEYPEQYEGKTLEQLQSGDSFTIIDLL